MEDLVVLGGPQLPRQQIGGRTYAVSRESIWQGPFVLQAGDQVLARARKGSAFVQAFDIDLAGRPLKIEATWIWGRGLTLYENGSPIGSIAPTTWFGRLETRGG